MEQYKGAPEPTPGRETRLDCRGGRMFRGTAQSVDNSLASCSPFLFGAWFPTTNCILPEDMAPWQLIVAKAIHQRVQGTLNNHTHTSPPPPILTAQSSRSNYKSGGCTSVYMNLYNHLEVATLPTSAVEADPAQMSSDPKCLPKDLCCCPVLG